MMRRRILAAALSVGLAAVAPMAVFAEETSTEEVSSVEEESEPFDYSEGFDDNGFFSGVKALDYVELPDYSTIELYENNVVPSEDDVMSSIESVLNQHTTTNQITDADKEVEDGTTVNIDYVGKVDGEEFEGGSTEGNGTNVTIGVTSYIDGFLDQLIGHKPGETFDINVTFPDPYENNTDLSGKDAVFTITINYIEEKVVPEFNDEFVKEYIEDYDSAEDYRQYVYDGLYKNNLSNELFNYITENCTVSEVPESVLDTIYNQRYNNIETVSAQYGISVEDYLSYYGMDEDGLKELCKTYAENFLEFQAIMEKEGLTMDSDTAKRLLDIDDETYNSYVDYYGEKYILFAECADYVFEALEPNVVLVEEPESSEEESSEAGSEEASEEATTEEASTEE